MQAYFNLSEIVDDSTKFGEHLILYIAVLLVRKRLGNDSTKLHALEMLEWKITDMRKKYKINNKYPSTEKYYK